MEIKKIKDLEIALKSIVPNASTHHEYYNGLKEKLENNEEVTKAISKLLKSQKLGFQSSFFSDFKTQYAYKCTKCGRTGTSLTNISACPDCGNAMLADNSRYWGHEKKNLLFIVAESTDDYAIILSADIRTRVKVPTIDPANPCLALDNAEYITIFNHINSYIFSYKFGLRKISSTFNSLVVENLRFRTVGIEILETDNLIDFRNRLKEIVFFKDKDFITALNNHCNYLSSSLTKTSTAKRKRDETIEYFSSLKLKDVSSIVEEKMKENCDVFVIKKEVVDNTTICDVCCPSCGNVHEKTFTCSEEDSYYKEEDCLCPSCGKKYKISQSDITSPYGSTVSKSIFCQKWEKIDDETLLCRMFISSVSFEIPYKSFSYASTEIYRAFIVGKKTFLFKSDDGKKFNSVSLSELPEANTYMFHFYISMDKSVLINDLEELKKLITNSSLRYSGVLDAWGLGINPDCGIDSPGVFHRRSYLYAWQKNSCVEQLMKCGLYDIAKDICNGSLNVKSLANPKASGILDILNITKPVLQISREVNASFSQLSTIKRLWEADRDIDAEMYSTISNARISEYLIRVKKEHNISFKKQIEYIKYASDFQCISQTEVARLWSDYLSICKNIGYKLKNKEKKYPDSLKREHDVVTKIQSTIKMSSFDKDAFKAKAEENARFNYSLKEVDLFVRAPQTPQEVINEGMDLHHCVSRYVNPIINGSAIVMFIRKHSDPDTSYYTVEVISDGTINKITQIKGDMNLDFDPSTSEGKTLSKFIDKWCKSKKLILELEDKD